MTNTKDLGRTVPGSHHACFLDTLHRRHAVVEDRVRTEKATGIRHLPFHGFERNQAWLLGRVFKAGHRVMSLVTV